MQSQINRITDILRRDDWISGAMQYTEQISWILFLKFLNDYEETQYQTAVLNGGIYSYLLDEDHRRDIRACPKKDGKIDFSVARSGEDLREFVNKDLFPYLKWFRKNEGEYFSITYKIWEIFYFLDNKIESWHTLREVLDIVDELNFQSQEDLFELSKIYEDLLQGMGNDGGNSGEFYTPRAIIKAMVQAVDPQIGQTVYDWAAGSCGFLIEAFDHMKPQEKSTKDLEFLNHSTFFGNEKTPLAYVMWVMNMILHGIENPNINKQNTLTTDIRGIEEKDRFDIILANPPFGGKEKDQIQANFPIKTNATEMLFLQHFMKKLKTWGKAAIIVPEWVLFNTGNAFQDIKKIMLQDYNLHTIVSLPAGVFLPYSGVKTNIIFFDKVGSTKDIRYYEVNLDRKLTKNKPITFEDMSDFLASFKDKKVWENSRFVNINDIKDFDISAKNPAKIKEQIHRDPKEILSEIEENNKKIEQTMNTLKNIIL